MATYSEAAQRELDRKWDEAEDRRIAAAERKKSAMAVVVPPLVRPLVEQARPIPTFQFPGDGLAMFDPRFGLRLTQGDCKPWAHMDIATAERFAEWLRGQIRRAEDYVAAEPAPLAARQSRGWRDRIDVV